MAVDKLKTIKYCKNCVINESRGSNFRVGLVIVAHCLLQLTETEEGRFAPCLLLAGPV